MHHRKRRGSGELHHKISIAYCIDAGPAEAVKSKTTRDGFTINLEPAARKRPCAKRQTVDAVSDVSKPSAISLDHLEVGKQKMSKQNRLRSLDMGVSGKDATI